MSEPLWAGVYEYHKESSKKITDYRKIEDQLDKYKRGFEILDLVLQGTATAFHGVNTYHSIKRNIEGYWKLVDTYHDKILSHGAVWSSDTLILNTSSRTVDEIKRRQRISISHIWTCHSFSQELRNVPRPI